jgi:hypothetical protein
MPASTKKKNARNWNKPDGNFKLTEQGEQPRDPRPLIDQLVEIERKPQADRTLIEREALALYESTIGDLDERVAIVSKFQRAAESFAKFLRLAGLEHFSEPINQAIVVAVAALHIEQPQT